MKVIVDKAKLIKILEEAGTIQIKWDGYFCPFDILNDGKELNIEDFSEEENYIS